jgi:hypothetical protein
MRKINPGESMDAEGLPEVEDHPPGIDVELAQESMMVPRDHPVAAGDDPAYPTTAEEERRCESVADRAARENPAASASEMGVGGGVQGSHAMAPDAQARGDQDRETGVPTDPGVARSAEEAAVHIRSDADDL